MKKVGLVYTEQPNFALIRNWVAEADMGKLSIIDFTEKVKPGKFDIIICACDRFNPHATTALSGFIDNNFELIMDININSPTKTLFFSGAALEAVSLLEIVKGANKMQYFKFIKEPKLLPFRKSYKYLEAPYVLIKSAFPRDKKINAELFANPGNSIDGAIAHWERESIKYCFYCPWLTGKVTADSSFLWSFIIDVEVIDLSSNRRKEDDGDQMAEVMA